MATYLITQATGGQSQAVIAHLLKAGVKIHALVRNPDKANDLLKQPGVTIFKGETNNVEDVLAAAQGCKGAFLNTYPIPELEVQQAKAATEACRRAGVESVVLATTMYTDDKSFWDNELTKQHQLHGYYQSKHAIEAIVREAGFTYTILRAGFIHFDYFLPNVLPNYPWLHSHGELRHAFDEGRGILHTDADDIGKYAAAALLNPAKFGGQEIELGNEAITPSQAADILTRVSGRTIPVRKLDDAEFSEAIKTYYPLWWHRYSNHKDWAGADVVAKEVQEKFGIPFTSFEDAIKRDKARLLETLPKLDG
ncbi:NmrA-like family protein [Stachybotrys elegans]|uniref:NmrA-like family protein n=1 Tax=Stachybotrys elegans TaxID=80388 RepID=A0A8K0T0N8_9HYPO|nr:NmrA-like family protein [Stachybotrys elegans]